MPSQTPNLDLYKVNGETDGNDTFNVDVVLNDNWDKIDAAVGGVETEIEGLKQSGVDGKNRLETAIIAKEGTVSKQGQVATFEELDKGIHSIPTGTDTSDATAAAGDIISGKIAYGPSGKITGTIPDRGAGGTVTPGATDQTKAAGRYTTAITIKGVPVPPANVLVGTTIAGTPGQMPNRSAENHHMPGLEATVWAGDRFFIRPPGGFYTGESWVTALVPGLTAANLRAGVNVAGLIGTLQEGVQYAMGNIGAMAPMTPINVDCGFVPRIFAWSGLRDDFSVRGSTIKYLTADGIEHSDVGNSIFYIVTSLRQVMTIQNNDSSGRYIRNVIWQAWA